jgi:hypothetical protein
MWRHISLSLSSLMGCGNRYSEECFMQGRAGGIGTTDLNTASCMFCVCVFVLFISFVIVFFKIDL